MKREHEPLLAHLQDLLAPLGRISCRAMFGGHGLYCDGVFFALLAEGRPYLKVDALTEADFRAAGCRPFRYEGKGRAIEMSYWSLPESALDAAEDLLPWARLALAAATRKIAVKGRKSSEKR